MEPKVIRRLDQAVVNRIAAGEIINRPANALKELIENSLDAKSSTIQVTVKSGGLKYLQIQDNGTGIRKDNMEIVCERFTTSKLQNFEDLSTISTYGFRGEALASISYVAHLIIQTKTAQEKCAYKACYEDGKLIGSLKACAGNQGTHITVEDFFYNVPQRKQALRSPNEEFQQISDVVGKYAIHNANVSFSLKKMGENNSIRTQINSTHQQNIGIIYGYEIVKDLLDTQVSDSMLGFEMSAIISSPNYTTKKTIFLLFINHRLVESSILKSAIDQIYSVYLPKGKYPFVYISLEIEPTNVDVNVHPTKHEVHFLHEKEIIDKIAQSIEKILIGTNASKVFYTQTLLPGASDVHTAENVINNTLKSETIYAKDLVRTDSKEQKLEKFFGNLTSSSINTEYIDTSPVIASTFQMTTFDTVRKETKLTSVLKKRKTIESECHIGLRKLLNNLTFVGCVNRTQAIIQHETHMYLCNTIKLSEELFYQILLYEFENFGKITLETPLSIRELALLALDTTESGWTPDDGPKEDLANSVNAILVNKAEILTEYYNMVISNDGMLESLPILLDNHIPSLCNLPMYVLRIATEVDWEIENNFIHTFSRETARFYSEIALTIPDDQWKWTVEHILYPGFRQYFLPPKPFMYNKSFLKIASLSHLYKVFERC